ncbi:hypothetical protein V5O48_018263 [Marasmius crinis-equi]|uniref:Protein kinase domain-containing protein n=1 Tax=Marasmius crinis-equi TaxID=585013 RepID=A0ABR3ELN9_9AGAR
MASPPDPIETIINLVKLGQEIRERYKIYTHAEADLGELDSRLRASLLVLEVFQKVIERGIGSLLYRQQQDIIRLVEHLQGVFDRLDKQLTRFPREEKMSLKGKLRWTFKGKSGYEAILHEMAGWRSEVRDIVDIIKLLQEEEKEEDRNLYKQLFGVCGGTGIRSADAMDDVLHGRGDASELPAVDNDTLSNLEAETNLKDGNRLVIKGHLTFMECRYFETRSPQEIEESIFDVKKLASVLHQVDAASMHILRCRGTTYQAEGYNRSLLLYELPSEPANKSKWTLAQAIEDKRTLKPSLSVRIRYAVEIALAVMFTHAAGLVHKSINTENVLILNNPPSNNNRHESSIYLVGFDAARLRDLSAYSAQRAETDPLKRLFQHPERQIALQDGKVVRFGIRHDMYSLGVVLLELAMWRRVQHINDPDLQKLRSARGQAFDPRKLQAKLAELVEQSLAGLMGTRYADAVLCCLQDTVSEQKTEREMREVFYERVLQSLKQIVV